jgi:hypothetical protein
MAKHKSIKRIWRPQESGLVVPEGTVSDLLLSSSESYLQIKEKAFAVESLYAENKVSLPPTSDLARLLADAMVLSDAWLTGQEDKLSMTVLFRVAQLNRIADALLTIHMVPHRNVFMTALASGSLDLLDRKQSTAKDYLWELELWSILKRSSFDAILEEPPDIVVRFADCRIGIACKKIYSERHVQNVLSQAVAQIEGDFDFGIVAINIDDLVPPNQILRTPNQEKLSQYISDLNAL